MKVHDFDEIFLQIQLHVTLHALRKMEQANMAHPQSSFRKLITRGLALMVMLCVYGFSLIGASTVMLGVSSAPSR